MITLDQLLDQIAAAQLRYGVEFVDVETERAVAAAGAADRPGLERVLQDLHTEGQEQQAAQTLRSARARVSSYRGDVIDLVRTPLHLPTSSLAECQARLTDLVALRDHATVTQQRAARLRRRLCRDGGQPGSAEHVQTAAQHYAAVQREQLTWVQSDGANPRISLRMQCFDIQLHYAVTKTRISPVFHCFGTLPNGRNCCAVVRDFEFYLYVRVPDASHSRWAMPVCRAGFLEDLNAALVPRLRPRHGFSHCRRHGCRCEFRTRDDGSTGFAPKFDPCIKKIHETVKAVVTRVDFQTGRSIVGYHPHEQTFLKVTVAQPFLLRRVAYWIQAQASKPGHVCSGMEVHEATLAPSVRFMADKNIVGCGWLALHNAHLVDTVTQVSTCDLEVSLTHTDLVSHPDSVQNAPVRILALDIECMAVNVNVFPTADTCPVIQVSTLGRIYGQPERDTKKVFCLGHLPNTTPSNPDAWKTDNTTDGGTIIDCTNETALFLAVYQYILEFDPTLITGYNSSQSSLPLFVSTHPNQSNPAKIFFFFFPAYFSRWPLSSILSESRLHTNQRGDAHRQVRPPLPL